MLRDPRPAPRTPREVERTLAKRLPRATSQAVILTGVRRSGKSTLLRQLLRGRRKTALINFEDTRLFGLGPENFPVLLSLVEELYPGAAPIGLDEVQEIRQWQRLVRALLDRGRGVYLTGSNASLLGRELGAKLTGRHLSFALFPFQYQEYLNFTRQRPGEPSLRAFLDEGGFPTYLRERDPRILGELLRDVIHRDIVARYGIREMRHLMNLTLFLLANTGQPVSLQRLTRILSIPTVSQTSRYVEYLQDAYLLVALPKFSPSFRKRVVSPHKYYAVDTGLRRAVSPQSSPDTGHRLENAVCLALHSRGERASYAGEQDRWECDFITDTAAIQSCAELTERNRDRELAGLIQAARFPGKRRLLVLTLNQTDRFKTQGLRVDVLPAWRWLSNPA